jgi:beta-lactam-binding protein with PASTA domain
MSFTDRLRRFGRILLVLFILASAAFLSALTAMRIAIEGRQVKMPNVVGRDVIEAEHTLSPDGLGLRIEDRVFSDYPENVIVRQSPPADLRVKVGERAHVVVSLGPQRVMIPDLRSASLRTARIQLLRDGLQMGEASSLFLSGSTADTVMMQTPPAGALDAASPRVDILVSLGEPPPAWVMPNVTGLPEPEATQRLGHAGLKNLRIVNQPEPEAGVPATASGPGATSSSSSASPLPDGFVRFSNNPAPPAPSGALTNGPRGIVLAQDPAAGSRVEPGTQIELRVAQ